MSVDTGFVGRVLRANTKGFACGTHSTKISAHHDFGMFVKAPIANEENFWVIGLIYAVEIQDDQLVNELVMSEYVDINILSDQRENRMVPVEIKVLSVGYKVIGNTGIPIFVHNLPPRPPMSLSDVQLCSADEVFQFTQQQDFFRIVLEARDVPADELLASAIIFAASVFADDHDEYRSFLVTCGRRLAQDLSVDLKRLSHILTMIKPN